MFVLFCLCLLLVVCFMIGFVVGCFLLVGVLTICWCLEFCLLGEFDGLVLLMFFVGVFTSCLSGFYWLFGWFVCVG